MVGRTLNHYKISELLGKGGTWEAATLEGDGEKVTLWGWSFPAQQGTRSPLSDAGFPRGPGPNLGLLHCDRDQAGSPYAPVMSRELEAAGLDGWLLGHIHVPDALTAPSPSGYLGSVTGANPGEAGAHGRPAQQGARHGPVGSGIEK